MQGTCLLLFLEKGLQCSSGSFCPVDSALTSIICDEMVTKIRPVFVNNPLCHYLFAFVVSAGLEEKTLSAASKIAATLRTGVFPADLVNDINLLTTKSAYHIFPPHYCTS
ncbi:hypothetical protein PITCH_A1520020 [uncultured Desulfobacterium sp.]|uniref:Uncharacterized protein n=1 Tax=uncultured Desulfobacterium sp. TaxID=201089 RepID=A0A445MTM1_9BACT|nr:hypothetical protein PITCH_A1520020 [uncultured Desulfobacterium sp.]